MLRYPPLPPGLLFLPPSAWPPTSLLKTWARVCPCVCPSVRDRCLPAAPCCRYQAHRPSGSAPRPVTPALCPASFCRPTRAPPSARASSLLPPRLLLPFSGPTVRARGTLSQKCPRTNWLFRPAKDPCPTWPGPPPPTHASSPL